jgi:hypothetical protein
VIRSKLSSGIHGDGVVPLDEVDHIIGGSEPPLNDRAPSGPGTAQPASATPPSITATAGCVVTGAGFLADHHVTIRVTYTAADVSDYFTYTSDHRGDLYAELPTSRRRGVLLIAATDHRADPCGACGLLWSNTETVPRSSS